MEGDVRENWNCHNKAGISKRQLKFALNTSISAYTRILFMVNGVLGLAPAYGIWRGSKTWAWLSGLLVAGGALALFFISRSRIIPGWEDELSCG